MWSKSGGREANIPANPDENYAHDGWQSYGHWLGTGNLVGGKLAFLPFKKALVYARSLKLKSAKESRVWSESESRKGNIPSTPHVIKHGTQIAIQRSCNIIFKKTCKGMKRLHYALVMDT